MAKSSKTVKPAHVGSISATAQKLLDQHIGYTIHYPAQNSAVFTIEGNLDQGQLATIVELGGLWNDKFRILVTEDAA